MTSLLSKNKVIEIFEILKEDNPAPKTELEYTNGYTLLVAVVLSAQATDVGVNKATRELFKLADAPGKMLDLGLDGLKQYIKTIGLYNAKADNIIKLSKKLIDEFDSNIPNNFKDLTSLPGVGSKTAYVVLNEFFGEPTIAVDTHVFRVSNRLGIVAEKTPAKTELTLPTKIPQEYQRHAHHWLILHGRYTCIARKPKCDICKLKDICPSYKKDLNS